MACGPYRSMIAVQRSTIVSSASSQVIRSNCLEPYGPTRFIG